MPKKLTMLGALMALVFGALAIFQGSANAAPGQVQGFDSTGTFSVNSGTCWYDGSGTPGRPVNNGTALHLGGQMTCGANTSETNVAAGVGTTAVPSFTYIQLPQGNRLTLPITFTPSAPGQFGNDPTQSSCRNPALDECGQTFTHVPDPADGSWTSVPTPSEVIGQVTANPDLFCDGPAGYDVLAASHPGSVTNYPDDIGDGQGWQGFDFVRTADAASGGPNGANAYVNQIKPFPANFPFVSLDTAWLLRLFLGGGAAGTPGAGFAIPDSPLQLYTAESAYVPGLNVSVALLAGSPTPPDNGYLCLDSPQNSETSVDYIVPPTTSGLYPRWVIFTSAADSVNGAVNRILDLQCVGVGTVTSGAGATNVGATDADDDCLATPADTNDANPDQDSDGLPDGVEAFAGSPINGAGDTDGATDYEEMFQFTNPNVNDTDGDGSLDKQDNGSDENVATPIVEDTIADDNCPAVSNYDQLNTDSAPNYHGGNVAWNNTNAGTLPAGVAPGPLATTLITTWASAAITVAGTTATVTTSSTHNLYLNQIVEISGVTGTLPLTAPNAATNSTYRQALNVVTLVKAPAGSTFTFAVPAGTPAGSALGTIIIRPATGDQNSGTNPDQDALGDACDTDDDNDNIGDVAETNITYEAWVGPASAKETSCLGDGSGSAGFISLNTTNGDSDQDMVLDGIECQQGSRPDIPGTSSSTCSAPNGCPLPPSAAALGVTDVGADGLYGENPPPTLGFAEIFYRTFQIRKNDNTTVTNIDGDSDNGEVDKDSDADWNIANLPGSPSVDSRGPEFDGTEVRFYGTEPSNGDTDVDGCDDGREIADVNGDRGVNVGDQSAVAGRKTLIAALDNGKAGDPVANDGKVNPYGLNFDTNKDRTISVGDQGDLAFYVGKGGSCQNNRQLGRVISNATKLPF